MVSSYGKTVIFGEESKIIGERINPTGKKKFKQALVERDMDYILRGIRQRTTARIFWMSMWGFRTLTRFP